MTDTEQKAMEMLRKDLERAYNKKTLFVETTYNALDISLNLIQKQDTEILDLKETIKKQEKSREHLKKQLKGEIAVKDTEINKLNNVIDRMASWLWNDDTVFGHGDFKDINTPEKIKEYFMKEDK